MPLRKSPTRTPALVAANRRNAQQSTGPRTAQGKARSRLNRLRHGLRSPEYVGFSMALADLPPGRVLGMAKALRVSRWMRHPLYLDLIESCIEAEADLCRPRVRGRPRKNKKNTPFEAGMLLKIKSDVHEIREQANMLMKTSGL